MKAFDFLAGLYEVSEPTGVGPTTPTPPAPGPASTTAGTGRPDIQPEASGPVHPLDAWLAAENLNTTSFQLTGLQTASVYHWTVYATDNNTAGTWADDTLSFNTNPYASINGTAYYFMGSMEGVPEVSMTLTGTNDEVLTDANGFYLFDNLFIGSNYTVEPAKLEPTWVPAAIISMSDAVAAAQGAAAFITLTPEQVIAADVQGGTGLNFFDAVKISQYSVHQITQFSVAIANSSDWAFIPNEIAYSPLAGNMTDDYASILYGDVTGNWTNAASILARGFDDQLFGQYVVKDGKVTVPVMVLEDASEVFFLQIQLEYDPALLEFESASLTDLAQNWNLIVPPLLEGAENRPGHFNMGAFNIEALASEGAVFNLTFNLLDDAGDIQLTMPRYSSRDSQLLSSDIMISPIELPTEYALMQNYPNPFNPQTTIKFDLKEAGHVYLNIFNSTGQKVRTLVDDFKPAGHYQVVFDGRNDRSGEFASGIYFYQIRCNNFTSVKKMVFMK